MGPDLLRRVEVGMQEWEKGGKLVIRDFPRGKILTVQVPPRCTATLRLRGQGRTRDGDMWLRVVPKPARKEARPRRGTERPRMGRLDVEREVAVGIFDLIRGCRVKVAVIRYVDVGERLLEAGQTFVEVRVPALWPPGNWLKCRGQGLADGKRRGDLYLRVVAKTA